MPASGPSNVTKVSYNAIVVGSWTFAKVEFAFGDPQSKVKLAAHKDHKSVTKVEYHNGKGRLAVWYDNKTAIGHRQGDGQPLPDK